MSRIDFVVSNPGHHWATAKAVGGHLTRSGIECRGLSLCELRGFVTPPSGESLELRAVLGTRLRRSPSWGAGQTTTATRTRALLRSGVWRTLLQPRLRRAWTYRPDLVVLQNDAAYPYDLIASLLRKLGIPFALLQEGIRFPLPSETASLSYGLGRADLVACWGQSSLDHFRSIGVPESALAAVGCPRFDNLESGLSAEARRAVLAELRLNAPPLVLVTNPIDDQGFCSHNEKLSLIRNFVGESADWLMERSLPCVIKLHHRESESEVRQALSEVDPTERVRITKSVPIQPLLAAGSATVIMASTVGLEALLLGSKLGVMEIPGAGHVFDYVSSGAAIGLRRDLPLGPQLDTLLSPGSPQTSVVKYYLDRHFANRGQAAEVTASILRRICGE